jgi:hypothetical protein
MRCRACRNLSEQGAFDKPIRDLARQTAQGGDGERSGNRLVLILPHGRMKVKGRSAPSSVVGSRGQASGAQALHGRVPGCGSNSVPPPRPLFEYDPVVTAVAGRPTTHKGTSSRTAMPLTATGMASRGLMPAGGEDRRRVRISGPRLTPLL